MLWFEILGSFVSRQWDIKFSRAGTAARFGGIIPSVNGRSSNSFAYDVPSRAVGTRYHPKERISYRNRKMDNERKSSKRSRFDQTEPEAKRSSRFDRRSRSPSRRVSETQRSRSPLAPSKSMSPAVAESTGPKAFAADPAAAAGKWSNLHSLTAHTNKFEQPPPQLESMLPSRPRKGFSMSMFRRSAQ